MAEIIPDEQTFGGAFSRGVAPPPLPPEAGKFDHLRRDSLVLNPGEVVKTVVDPKKSVGEKAGYTLGRAVGDVLRDGTRNFWWAANHPLGQLYIASQPFGVLSGLTPDDTTRNALLERGIVHPTLDQLRAQKAAELGLTFNGANPAAQTQEVVGQDGKTRLVARQKPFRVPYEVAEVAVPAIATAVAQLTSGNTDWLNLSGGGRLQGYEAILPKDGNKLETSNPIGELAARYLFGRTGRVLPWEQFTQERPEVAPGDYEAYKAYQFDPGFLNLGLFRATDRNLEGEPEYMMMGYRVPLSTITAAAGALTGGALGSRAGEEMVSNRLRTQGIDSVPETLRVPGHRRLAGAAIGAILGGVAGNVGGRIVNKSLIQPIFNPEAVAADQAWEQQQRQLGLL